LPQYIDFCSSFFPKIGLYVIKVSRLYVIKVSRLCHQSFAVMSSKFFSCFSALGVFFAGFFPLLVPKVKPAGFMLAGFVFKF